MIVAVASAASNSAGVKWTNAHPDMKWPLGSARMLSTWTSTTGIETGTTRLGHTCSGGDRQVGRINEEIRARGAARNRCGMCGMVGTRLISPKRTKGGLSEPECRAKCSMRLLYRPLGEVYARLLDRSTGMLGLDRRARLCEFSKAFVLTTVGTPQLTAVEYCPRSASLVDKPDERQRDRIAVSPSSQTLCTLPDIDMALEQHAGRAGKQNPAQRWSALEQPHSCSLRSPSTSMGRPR